MSGLCMCRYLFPNGQNVNPDIRNQVNVTPEQHIKVSKEQYDIYCNIDTTFEMCKICDTKLKSVRLDPCGHLLCNECLVHWMESSQQTAKKQTDVQCPFCRAPVRIKSHATVISSTPGDCDRECCGRSVLGRRRGRRHAGLLYHNISSL